VAYSTGEAAFPTTGAPPYRVSKGNGIHALWSPDGKELFYLPAGDQFVAVSVTTRPTFTFGNPVPVPRVFVDGISFERNYDIALDGKRFLGVVAAGSNTASGAAAAPQIQVVEHWFEEPEGARAGEIIGAPSFVVKLAPADSSSLVAMGRGTPQRLEQDAGELFKKTLGCPVRRVL
jgi:hypothetical protein